MRSAGGETQRGLPTNKGSTFIELLVAIVLLGTVTVAVLVALRTTVIATTIERDHSRAQQWLQSATGHLEAIEFGDCSNTAPVSATNGAGVNSYYQAQINPPNVVVPDGWALTSAALTVSSPNVWDGLTYVAFDCALNNTFRHQRILMTVTSPEGNIVETVEVIKLDR